jgi:uncharacterized protein (DUF1697 family)
MLDLPSATSCVRSSKRGSEKDGDVTRLLVLLRGINVSGHNKVPMADLRDALTSAGFDEVATYIQSGNIAANCTEAPVDVADRVGHILVDRFGVHVPVIVIPQAIVAEILRGSPFEPDANPATHLVYFSGEPVDVERVTQMDPDRWPGDVITGAKTAVYVSYEHGQSKTKLTLDQLERAAGTNLTGRNIRTVEKLIDL